MWESVFGSLFFFQFSPLHFTSHSYPQYLHLFRVLTQILNILDNTIIGLHYLKPALYDYARDSLPESLYFDYFIYEQ